MSSLRTSVFLYDEKVIPRKSDSLRISFISFGSDIYRKDAKIRIVVLVSYPFFFARE